MQKRRGRGRQVRLCGLVVLLAAQSACALVAPEIPDREASEPIDRELAQATFDSVWSQIHRTYYDSTFGGLDWNGVRKELRPRATAVPSNTELRELLHEMLDRLGDSHFVVTPGEFSEALTPEGAADLSGDVGLDMRWLDERLMVTRAVPGGPAAEAGVRPGWVILAVQGEDVDD